MGTKIRGGVICMKESDLFHPVKKWMEDAGWEVFAEVEAWGGRADIVGKSHPAYCVVELKTSLTMDLMEQAIRWKRFAHYIYIGIPMRKKMIHPFAMKVLSDNNIGVLQIDRYGSVYDLSNARYNRPLMRSKYGSTFSWDNFLYEEQKTWINGGSDGGGYVTPYKMTIKRVRIYLERVGDWRSINDILDHCETHYRSPKPSLAQALIKFEHEWCECRKIGRKNHFKIRRGSL
jgi:hypothetical protein